MWPFVGTAPSSAYSCAAPSRFATEIDAVAGYGIVFGVAVIVLTAPAVPLVRAHPRVVRRSLSPRRGSHEPTEEALGVGAALRLQMGAIYGVSVGVNFDTVSFLSFFF